MPDQALEPTNGMVVKLRYRRVISIDVASAGFSCFYMGQDATRGFMDSQMGSLYG